VLSNPAFCKIIKRRIAYAVRLFRLVIFPYSKIKLKPNYFFAVAKKYLALRENIFSLLGKFIAA
jgi:hypothetical protein